MRWRSGSRLKRVSEKDADSATRALYRDIEETLGIPPVPLFIPALAVCPRFLPLMWGALKPSVDSHEFFHSAQRLRADAYTRAYNYSAIPELSRMVPELDPGAGSRAELEELVEMFHYRDSLFLLLFSLQMQAMEGPTGKPGKGASKSVHPVYKHPLLLIEEEAAPGPTRKLFQTIRRSLQLPYVNTEYLALARWHEFFEAYWNLLSTMLQSPLYMDWEHNSREMAWDLARELPGPVDLSSERLREAGMAYDEITYISRLTDLFIHNLSGLVLSMAIAKIGLEGGNQGKSEGDKASTGKPEQVA